VEPVTLTTTVVPLAAEGDSGGSFLVSPNLGLMIWTLLVFGITMYVLSKVAFPRIQEALDKRANLIRDSIDEAEKTRNEANEILKEYRGRLKEAREQADDIVARARKTAETTTADAEGDRLAGVGYPRVGDALRGLGYRDQQVRHESSAPLLVAFGDCAADVDR